MARFRYRMQNILELKEKLEEQERNNFAARRRALDEEEEKMRLVLDKRNAAAAEGKALRNGTVDIQKIKENRRMQEYAEEEVKQQRVKLKVAEKNLDMAKRRMTEAVQERKIHERMREKAFERFVAEVNAAEVKEIDELTSYVYGNKNDADSDKRSAEEEEG
ncbi:MAG: flagellar export protein FliJ [Lachnospiraceae bacterium]|nr:flagellar export protein FliJ [Lachnospiraceae bacterium]